MKKILCLLLIVGVAVLLTSCAQADAIKNGIKDKLSKPAEEVVNIEPIMAKPEIVSSFEHAYSFLVIQEVKGKNLIATIDGTDIRYSVPNWFGDVILVPGTYIIVEHADNSLPTNPMQFGFIYSMLYFSADGNIVEGIKP
jgi:hypothetical protein